MAVPTFVAATQNSGSGSSFALTEPAHANGDMLLAQIAVLIPDIATRNITGHGTKITQHGGPDAAGYNNGFYLSMFWWVGNGTATSRSWTTTEGNTLTWYIRIIAYRGPTAIVGFTTYQDHYVASAWNPTWDCPGITSSTDAVSMVIHAAYGGSGPSGPLAPASGYTDTQTTPYEWRRMAVAQTFDPGAHTASQVSSGTARSLHVVARTPAAPNAPTLGAPAASSVVPYHRAITYSWTHSNPDGQAQTGYKFRIVRVSDGRTEYRDSVGGWSTTETTVTSSADSVSTSLNSTMAGESVDWSVATVDVGGTGPYATARRLHPGFEGFGGAMV